jgi:hypothetical protein
MQGISSLSAPVRGDTSMRRILLSFAFVVLALVATTPSSRALPNDAQVAQMLVGRWEWQSQLNGAVVLNQLTLAGGGDFTYTSAMQSYQVTSWGVWQYSGGYLQFRTTGSSSLDPTGRPIGLGPVQILGIGPDWVRTPAGIVRRTL